MSVKLEDLFFSKFLGICTKKTNVALVDVMTRLPASMAACLLLSLPSYLYACLTLLSDILPQWIPPHASLPLDLLVRLPACL